jgi:DNA-binding CsgD family transcriptional regulator
MFVNHLRQQIAELHQARVPHLQIAHRLGVAEATVHYHLRQRSVEPPRRPASLPTERALIEAASTRDRVAALLGVSLSHVQIARKLNISKQTVTYHARRLGKPVDDKCSRRYDWSAVQRYYDEGHSVRDCVKAFGFALSSWSAAVARGAIVPRPRARSLDEMFAPNSHRHRRNLKLRLIAEGIKEGRCELCGTSEWLGQPLTMALHHVNGDRLDNRIENLQLLCPNCHSQTDSYGGRNAKRIAA